ncbi:1,4-alpha-glucan branching protein GlgB [Thalassobaculum sp. OXR-137]|uniref:1,4-alpha-glucan branching protein GlgB n=1 Tax=Thalassobaculum sp. OXR-137 TaxID=3100173 RepID=UPI0039FC06BA
MDPTTAADIARGIFPDPFSVLGIHPQGDGVVVRAYIPGAERVELIPGKSGKPVAELSPAKADGVFAARLGADPGAYRLRAHRGQDTWDVVDPYAFGPVIGEQDEYYLSEGSHLRLWQVLGAHPITHEGVEGVHFAVWAPNAMRVSVVGEFNAWDGRRHVMRRRGATGVWEIFLPGLEAGMQYKYEIRGPGGMLLPLKADPIGFGSQHPPETSSIVRDLRGYGWPDDAWMASRAERNRIDAPISIYEVHLGSWKRRWEEDGRMLSYKELAEELVPYVAEMGFTHIEVMPISEFPFDGSWGYQPVGLFAPSIRFGRPEEFRDFVAACHAHGLGLILDWVPGHFPSDPHGLGQFDGTALYEHADPREGFHKDWNTLIYNYGRREVSNFLIANALYWLEAHHADGLRVDAVASMLYRDYSRSDGEWVPNVHGGRENLEAIALLKRMNEVVYGADSSVMTIAEESTAWPGVTRPTSEDGLGFGFKWNMGWMNDTLEYMKEDPLHRRYHHSKMTFGLHYAFTENFILPLSHDEVVHGKGSLLGRMPGDRWQSFANLRTYYAFMWTHPGKKLLFMGGELAQAKEWNHDSELDWAALDSADHAGVKALVRDLNRLYRSLPALHRRDTREDGFGWINGGAEAESVIAWARYGEEGDAPVAAAFNFTPVPRPGWRFGVPADGTWTLRLNTDATAYGGSGAPMRETLESETIPWDGFAQSIVVDLPPLAGVVLEHTG